MWYLWYCNVWVFLVCFSLHAPLVWAFFFFSLMRRSGKFKRAGKQDEVGQFFFLFTTYVNARLLRSCADESLGWLWERRWDRDRGDLRIFLGEKRANARDWFLGNWIKGIEDAHGKYDAGVDEPSFAGPVLSPPSCMSIFFLFNYSFSELYLYERMIDSNNKNFK